MRWGRDRGFTLIEAMVVVLIVSILSVVAVVGYRKWVTSSRMMEAENLIENIRSAEDAFKGENGGYLAVSNGYAGTGTPSQDYPALVPGAFKTAWGADCVTQCVHANAWRKLGVQPSGPVTYGYAVYATNDPNAVPPPILINNASNALTGLKGTPWYVIEADGDPLGLGIFTKIFGLSGNNELFINNDTP